VDIEKASPPHGRQSLPRRGNRLTAWFGRTFLRLCGWSIQGTLPEVPKLLVVIAPHTSNWEFIYGIAAVFALRLDANWIGKHTLFKGPFGPIMQWFGGVPVDRRKAHGIVGQLVDEFNQRNHLFLGITPEGTRSRVKRWKTGFYHLAQQAGVPVIPVYFDYRLKRIVICDSFPLSGRLHDDLAGLQELFAPVTPKNPAKYNPQIS